MLTELWEKARAAYTLHPEHTQLNLDKMELPPDKYVKNYGITQTWDKNLNLNPNCPTDITTAGHQSTLEAFMQTPA